MEDFNFDEKVSAIKERNDDSIGLFGAINQQTDRFLLDFCPSSRY